MYIAVHGATTDEFFELDDIRHKHFRDIKNDSKLYSKKDWYAELVSLYNMWQHVTDDVIGLEHYRRYFTNNETFKPLNKDEISIILQTNDIICGKDVYPYSEVSGNSLWNWPLRHNKMHYYVTFIEMLYNSIDQKFAVFCNDYMCGSKLCHGNLFIAKRDVIDKYCTYLFSAFEKFEKIIKFNAENQRICGHIAEFLFGAWLEYNNYKIYYNSYHNATLGEIDEYGRKLHINALNDNQYKQEFLNDTI